MKKRHQEGIALITTLLILLLVSTMIVGLAWLVMGDQKLGGNNRDRQLAFYGAEAGMEQLTASLENAFNANYALDRTAINALMTTPGPPVIQGVTFVTPGSTTSGSGYTIEFEPNPTNNNIPAQTNATIPTGAFAGLLGIMTPYTLTVTAQSGYGSEVRLQRAVQTVGIPVFQFGFFSQTDLSFFAQPPFSFGGRVHTNGNLWLGEVTGNTLTMPQKVTAAGEVITANMVNGVTASSAGLGGTVNITTGSGMANLKTQSPFQSVTGTASMANYFQNISSYNPAFAGMASSVYNNNIAVKETGVRPLDLSIAAPSIGGQPIDLIRRPVHDEDLANNAKLLERYYGNPGLSLRILLSDYDAAGGCANSDISSTSATDLPRLSPNGANPATPVDLATLAWDVSSSGANPPYSAAPAWISADVGTSVFPLPVSYATDVTSPYTYTSSDGYWIQRHYPIITGCIKIDYQDANNPGTYVDVTAEILKLGYTGRNIFPQSASVVPPLLPTLPTTAVTQVNAQGPTGHAGVTTVGCTDPSPNAVIRLARVRDNPSYWAVTSTATRCGVWPTTTANQHGTDYWPNVLYDTREASRRDTALTTTQLPLAGAMHYVELDMFNLARWFTGAIGTSGTSAMHPNGFSVYFSDRRGNKADPIPPASVGATPMLTGGFGYSDFVNPSSASACPDSLLNGGEDVEGDYNSNGVDPTPVQRTYGATPTFPNVLEAPGVVKPITTLNSAGVLMNHPSCAGPATNWPFAIVNNSAGRKPGYELRENPAVLFRRALKMVNGDTLSLGTCNSVPCGLTVVAENPVYVQACYNNPGQCAMATTTWSTTNVAASVIADSLTMLSDRWNDVNSFAYPYGVGGNITGGGRNAITTTYRMAVVGGKGVPFRQPSGGTWDTGTDGGAHNFLRQLENWNAQTMFYDGSIVSMYYNHQAVGIFKCCVTVYWPPTRGYQFDTNFLTPNLLPPLTPMLRTINTIGFTQIFLPTQ